MAEIGSQWLALVVDLSKQPTATAAVVPKIVPAADLYQIKADKKCYRFKPKSASILDKHEEFGMILPDDNDGKSMMVKHHLISLSENVEELKSLITSKRRKTVPPTRLSMSPTSEEVGLYSFPEEDKKKRKKARHLKNNETNSVQNARAKTSSQIVKTFNRQALLAEPSNNDGNEATTSSVGTSLSSVTADSLDSVASFTPYQAESTSMKNNKNKIKSKFKQDNRKKNKNTTVLKQGKGLHQTEHEEKDDMGETELQNNGHVPNSVQCGAQVGNGEILSSNEIADNATESEFVQIFDSNHVDLDVDSLTAVALEVIGESCYDNDTQAALLGLLQDTQDELHAAQAVIAQMQEQLKVHEERNAALTELMKDKQDKLEEAYKVIANQRNEKEALQSQFDLVQQLKDIVSEGNTKLDLGHVKQSKTSKLDKLHADLVSHGEEDDDYTSEKVRVGVDRWVKRSKLTKIESDTIYPTTRIELLADLFYGKHTKHFSVKKTSKNRITEEEITSMTNILKMMKWRKPQIINETVVKSRLIRYTSDLRTAQGDGKTVHKKKESAKKGTKNRKSERKEETYLDESSEDDTSGKERKCKKKVQHVKSIRIDPIDTDEEQPAPKKTKGGALEGHTNRKEDDREQHHVTTEQCPEEEDAKEKSTKEDCKGETNDSDEDSEDSTTSGTASSSSSRSDSD